MKRLLRILLNAGTVVSLVLCVATFVLWLRSYWCLDVFPISRGLAVASDGGSVDFRWFNSGDPYSHMGWHWSMPAASYVNYTDRLAKLIRFWVYTNDGNTNPDVGLTVPHWALVALTSLAPGFWLRRRARSGMAGFPVVTRETT